SLAATQFFGILGFVGLNLGCLLLVLNIFTDKLKGNFEAILIAAISLIVSAVSWLLAVIIFAASFKPSGSELGYSFGLAICALVLAAVSGVLVLLARQGGSSVGSN
ncbi:epithelial membrane protein 2, partial [Biomphalaria glabrata]